MGFLSGITNSISKAVSNVGSLVGSAVKSVASGVISTAASGLKSITDGFVNTAADLAKGVASSAMRMADPLGMLGSLGLDKMLGQGLDGIADLAKTFKNAGFDAVASQLQQLISQATERTTSDGVSATLPPLAERMKEFSEALAKLLGGSGTAATASAASAAPAASTASTSSAASAAPAASTSSSSSSTPVNTSTGGYSGVDNLLSGLKKPTDITGNENEVDLAKKQQEWQKYNQMITMLTQLMQIQHDTRKAVIQNFRA